MAIRAARNVSANRNAADRSIVEDIRQGVGLPSFSLAYDRAGTRLRRIHDVDIDYARLGVRPSHLGERELEFDRVGTRLRRLGELDVDYDRLGVRPRRLGPWEIEYDRVGTRIQRIGELAVVYDRMGSRPIQLGPVTIAYDRVGTRPNSITLDSEESLGDYLPQLYFVLYELQRRADADS